MSTIRSVCLLSNCGCWTTIAAVLGALCLFLIRWGSRVFCRTGCRIPPTSALDNLSTCVRSPFWWKSIPDGLGLRQLAHALSHLQVPNSYTHLHDVLSLGAFMRRTSSSTDSGNKHSKISIKQWSPTLILSSSTYCSSLSSNNWVRVGLHAPTLWYTCSWDAALVPCSQPTLHEFQMVREFQSIPGELTNSRASWKSNKQIRCLVMCRCSSTKFSNYFPFLGENADKFSRTLSLSAVCLLSSSIKTSSSIKKKLNRFTRVAVFSSSSALNVPPIGVGSSSSLAWAVDPLKVLVPFEGNAVILTRWLL